MVSDQDELIITYLFLQYHTHSYAIIVNMFLHNHRQDEIAFSGTTSYGSPELRPEISIASTMTKALSLLGAESTVAKKMPLQDEFSA